jgi:hypothetical protein
VKVAIPVLLVATWLTARGYAVRRWESALLLGLLSGGAGFAALETACPLTGFWHVAQSHLGVMVSLAAAILLLGLLLDRVRRS